MKKKYVLPLKSKGCYIVPGKICRGLSGNVKQMFHSMLKGELVEFSCSASVSKDVLGIIANRAHNQQPF